MQRKRWACHTPAATLAILVILIASSAGLAAGDTTVGWRGNWTGRFPHATPPVKWSKISKPMKGLLCSAQKPDDDKPAGVSATCGALTRWLVLGPFAASEDVKKAMDEEFVKGEANCEPKEGQAVGQVKWKQVETMGSVVNFASIFANTMPEGTPIFRYANDQDLTPYFGKPFVAYAHTWSYSPTETTLRCRIRAVLAVKVYVNGELVQELKRGKANRIDDPVAGEFSVQLNKGWNRVLCKARNVVVNKTYWAHIRSWYIDLGLRATRPYETESEGIAWATLVPSYHIACPLVVGDKVLAMSMPGDVVCLRKSDGKVLWIGTTTYYDLLSDADKKNNPAFAQVHPFVEELKKLDAAYVNQGTLSEKAVKRRSEVHKQISKLMGRADRKKYGGNVGHYVAANMPTPVSDGTYVYVWSCLGIATCYDLDGHRKWITMPGIRDNAAGRYASPVLAGDKMVVFEGRGHHKKNGLIAFDTRNGAIAWSMPHDKKAEPYSTLVPVRIAGHDYVLYGRYLVRGSDGKIMLENGKDLVGHVPTPVIENGVLHGITCRAGDVFKAKLPTGPENMVMKNEGKIKGLGPRSGIGGEPYIPSPLFHDGLLYLVDQSGHLCVIDTEAQSIVYKQELGMGKGWPYDFYHAPDWEYSTTFASPMLAGKYIYVFGLNGTTVVLEPGRHYKEVARNKIEDCLLVRESRWFRTTELPEFFASSPVAEGNRIYLRGGTYMYCIGEPADSRSTDH